ncbi:phage head-tail adapter protein [Paenibacillus sp. NRS-1783]|uniref:phage head closure protein n=1 Tax=Paenibacillus sp. NRS-1783 TaxID=3233907 RepID=UPI003D2840DB
MATSKRSQHVRYDKMIFLINSRVEQDELGNDQESESEQRVAAREMNVSSAEFYNAATVGLRPEKQFETYERFYTGAQKLKYNGILYRIVRTRNSGDKVIIICERVAADGH